MRHENGTTATTHYGWDGDRLVREESENQRSTIVYEPGSFVPMLRIDDTQEGPQLSAFVTDAIGTPMQLVAAHGETQWQGQPDDWAAVKNIRGNTAQPIRFQGQWQDEESGLYYNRHRYYDPQQGRYVSQDPIGLRGGTNLYGYVANPMGAVDPLGLEGFLAEMGASISNSARNGYTALSEASGPVIEKAWGYADTAANYLGGAGQIMTGGAMCMTVAGCMLGGPLIGLGANSIQEAYTGEVGYIRSAAISVGGEQAGNLAVDTANLGTSVGGLTRKVVSPDTWRLFRNINADYVRNYETMSRGGLLLEAGSGTIGVTNSIDTYIKSGESDE
ncbi:RHS repeat-associated core domain-containing protein [Vreelandella sp. EE27]